eukprot:Skav203086  [mRNA]  locus=scaffold447:141236:143077:+ [translate_table: standard]
MKVILQMISEKAAQKSSSQPKNWTQFLVAQLCRRGLWQRFVAEVCRTGLWQRFGSIRDALRHLDSDCDGSVDRSEGEVSLSAALASASYGPPWLTTGSRTSWLCHDRRRIFAERSAAALCLGGAMTTRAAARHAVRSQYFFVANDEEAFSVFGRQEVQDINTIRQVTDVGYLILFLAVGFGMLWLDSQANSLGNVLRLSEPIDYQGRLCGYDEEVKDAPLGYHPNPFNDMVICVSSCPETATDGSFTLPDGPMGKDFTRPAYPSANIYGQLLVKDS